MTSTERDYVLHKIEWEGFEYAFIDYSDFENVQDEQFHVLRRAYIEAHKALEAYISRPATDGVKA